MLGRDRDGKPGTLLAGTIQVAAGVALLSLLAAGWLSEATHDTTTLSRLAGRVSRGLDEPLTTGSLARGAAPAEPAPCGRR